MDKKTYIETVLGEVKFRADHPDIRQELDNHIYERSAYLRAKGMDAAEAETEAVRRMGDPQEMGRDMNKAHNPWLGWLWQFTSLIIMLIATPTIIAAGWWTMLEVRDILSEPSRQQMLEWTFDGENYYHSRVSETLELDGYSIKFTDAYVSAVPEADINNGEIELGGYYLAVFYEHKGKTGHTFYRYVEPETFINKEGDLYAPVIPHIKEPFFYMQDDYFMLWIEDTSEDIVYIDFDIFGQKATGQIDLTSLFDEMERGEQ